MELTLEQVRNFKYEKPEAEGYQGTTHYTFNNKTVEVPPWSHITSLARDVLDWLSHVYYYGIAVIGGMGEGKSSFARCLASHIVKERPDFQVTWATSKEFLSLKSFFESLPKTPQIIIFDDISGATSSLSEKEIAANFAALTTVRWILDPNEGKIPVICIICQHYTKTVLKSYRSQFALSVFTSIGLEESSNIDALVQKGTPHWKNLKNFSWMSAKQFKEHKFHITMPNGRKLEYQTDIDGRMVATLSKMDSRLIFYHADDYIEAAKKKYFKKFVEPEVIYKMITDAYGQKYGVQALRYALYRRNQKNALAPDAARATHLLETKIFSQYNTDLADLTALTWEEAHQKVPGRVNMKPKAEKEIIQTIDKTAVIKELPPENEPAPQD